MRLFLVLGQLDSQVSFITLQCSSFITQLVIKQILIKHDHVVAPSFLTMTFYIGIVGK